MLRSDRAQKRVRWDEERSRETFEGGFREDPWLAMIFHPSHMIAAVVAAVVGCSLKQMAEGVL